MQGERGLGGGERENARDENEADAAHESPPLL
jgi:hypothetical protein